jgi:hypothetical protein
MRPPPPQGTTVARHSNCAVAKKKPRQNGGAGARKPLRGLTPWPYGSEDVSAAAHNSLALFVAGFRQQSGTTPALR